MAKTETMYTRVEPALKENVEKILSRLGMTPSEAINIFLHQVVLTEGLPFVVAAPHMTKNEARAQLMAELKKGRDSVDRGDPVYSLEDIRVMLGVDA